jgi:Spy/CpxP family protein refolding chaperone
MKLSPLLLTLALATPMAVAQDAPPPPAQGQHPAAPMHHEHQGGFPDRGGPEHGGPGGFHHGEHGLEHLMPMGAWWRNTRLTQAIGLSADQQKKMDDLLLQNRIKLIDLHASLEKEELMLDPLLDTAAFDQGKAQGEVAKIADLRAQLEKTEAGMLLSIRGVLTADQWTKLRSQHDHGPQDDARRGPDGPRGPGGRGGHMPPPPPAAAAH